MRAQARKLTATTNSVAHKRRAAVAGKKQSESGVKRGPIVLGVLCCGMILLVAANLKDISNFVNRPVTRISIENQWNRLREDELRQVLGTYLGTGFFALDVNGLKSEIESHPWVRKASVARVWPDSLSLTIQERVAIARWGERQLLSQQGERFSPANFAGAAALPKLSGPEGSQSRVMQQYQFLNELFSPADLRLSELTLSERGSWELVVNDRIAISAGREKLIERVNRFISFYQSESSFDRIAIVAVDLRYDNGLAISRSDDELSGVAVR